MSRLEVGQFAPDFEIELADESHLSLSELLTRFPRGVIVYFYPRANTPGCTTEACDFRDSLARLTQTGLGVIGISPDQPAALRKFQSQHELDFLLGSDPEHQVLEAFGAWGEKNNYGRKTVGVIRSTLIIGADRKVLWAKYNVRAKGHVDRILKELPTLSH